MGPGHNISLYYFNQTLKNICVFIWLWRVLWPTGSLIFIVARRTFRCSMQTVICGMWDLVPGAGMKPRPPALGARSLSHWTTREVPALCLGDCNTCVQPHASPVAFT